MEYRTKGKENKITKINYSNLGDFKFKKNGNDYLLTNDYGAWIFLKPGEFNRFLAGELDKDGKVYKELFEKGFIKVGKKELVGLASRYLSLNHSIFRGPSLFIVVLTLRCNHRCLYCQVTPEEKTARGFDMSKSAAKKTVDLIFRTPSDFVRIEFQGGEPLLNWPVLKYIVEYAKIVNKKKKKNLQISMVSNITLMDDKKLKFLLDEDVSVSTSFDGPAYVHDKNRVYLEGGSSHKAVIGKIKKIQKAIKAKKKKNEKEFIDDINATLTISKFSLPYSKEIINEYMKVGFNNIFLRPLSPFGLGGMILDKIGYKAEEYIKFYQKSMDYILKLNLKGKTFAERSSFFLLKKILKGMDPNYLEMRSPCGAGIGQMAFNYDGRIFTCDEGRMADRMGYENFKLGNVEDNDYNGLIDNETTKTMCLASSLDAHGLCSNCSYKPFCGTCPLANFIEHGTIFPQMSNTDRCKINKAMFDYLFSKIKQPKYEAIFEKWLERER